MKDSFFYKILSGGLFILIFLFPGQYSICKLKSDSSNSSYLEKNKIAIEMKLLLDDMFSLWYPLSIDREEGGFFSNINYKWELEDKQDKLIVTQARHVWTASNAALFYKDKRDTLISVARHGYEFLRDVMWDEDNGGFYYSITRDGDPVEEFGQIIKRAYGIAFAIYGLAAYYKVSGDPEVLELAKETFEWLDKHSFDPEYGGYFQFMSEDGSPLKDGFGNVPPKDQNSSIHILECFTELYDVWPENKLKERLISLFHIIRDTIVTDKGYMNLYFNKEMKPVLFNDSTKQSRMNNYQFDHVSFGHDIETAYLLLETSSVLGFTNDTTTFVTAKKMVDHTINNGLDSTNSGLYDRGYYFSGKQGISIIQNTKEWWAQAEALNSLLLMAELFPDDKVDYYDKFLTQWEYIKEYLIDKEYGGWYFYGIDTAPKAKFAPKGTIWKVEYHTSRSLINCIRRLNYLKRIHKG